MHGLGARHRRRLVHEQSCADLYPGDGAGEPTGGVLQVGGGVHHSCTRHSDLGALGLQGIKSQVQGHCKLSKTSEFADICIVSTCRSVQHRKEAKTATALSTTMVKLPELTNRCGLHSNHEATEELWDSGRRRLCSRPQRSKESASPLRQLQVRWRPGEDGGHHVKEVNLRSQLSSGAAFIQIVIIQGLTTKNRSAPTFHMIPASRDAGCGTPSNLGDVV